MPTLNEERREVNDEFNMIVGCNIRYWRQANSLTLAELSDAAQMDISTLHRVESGVRSIRFKDAIEVAKVLQIQLTTLCRKNRGVEYV